MWSLLSLVAVCTSWPVSMQRFRGVTSVYPKNTVLGRLQNQEDYHPPSPLPVSQTPPVSSRPPSPPPSLSPPGGLQGIWNKINCISMTKRTNQAIGE